MQDTDDVESGTRQEALIDPPSVSLADSVSEASASAPVIDENDERRKVLRAAGEAYFQRAMEASQKGVQFDPSAQKSRRPRREKQLKEDPEVSGVDYGLLEVACMPGVVERTAMQARCNVLP